MGWVDEYYGFVGGEGFPDWSESWASEVKGGGRAVGGEEDNSVGVQGGEGVFDLGQGGGGGDEEVRDAGEEAVALGLGGAEV